MTPGTRATDHHGTIWEVLRSVKKRHVLEPMVEVRCVEPAESMRGLDVGDVRVTAACALTAVEGSIL